jgi:predicted transcriptional regulator
MKVGKTKVGWGKTSQEKGATTQAILHQTKWEITEGGATDNTIKKYIEDLSRAGLIEYQHPFWKVTRYGKTWLEKHAI